jgi:hypothetical protein
LLCIGIVGHVASIVAYTVTWTSGLANSEQGLATGLTTMTQQVAITIGVPALSAVAATQSVELTGIHLALSLDVAVTLLSVAFVWFGLRPRRHHHAMAAARRYSNELPTRNQHGFRRSPFDPRPYWTRRT